MWPIRKASVKQFQMRDSLVLLQKNTKALVKAEKEYHRISKKLLTNKFTTEYVNKLEQRYLQGKKPKREKFDQKMKDLASTFYVGLKEYIIWDVNLFKIFDEIARQDSREEYEAVAHLEEILQGLSKEARQSFFGREQLERFRAVMKRFSSRIAKDAQNNAVNAQIAQKGGKSRHAGFFTSLKSDVGLAEQIRRITCRKIPKREESSDRIIEILLEEVRKENLLQDFLMLFQTLLQTEAEAILQMAFIKRDLALLIKKHFDMSHHIVDHIKAFSAIASRYGQAPAELQEHAEVFNNTGQEAMQYMNDELANERAIFSLVRKEGSELDTIISALEQSTQRVEGNRTIYIPS